MEILTWMQVRVPTAMKTQVVRTEDQPLQITAGEILVAGNRDNQGDLQVHQSNTQNLTKYQLLAVKAKEEGPILSSHPSWHPRGHHLCDRLMQHRAVNLSSSLTCNSSSISILSSLRTGHHSNRHRCLLTPRGMGLCQFRSRGRLSNRRTYHRALSSSSRRTRSNSGNRHPTGTPMRSSNKTRGWISHLSPKCHSQDFSKGLSLATSFRLAAWE